MRALLWVNLLLWLVLALRLALPRKVPTGWMVSVLAVAWVALRPDPDALAWHNEKCFRG